MKISVLGVGTELTTGQILNKNASWISKKLKDHGVLTSLHLTIPDDRPLVLESLDICARHSEVLFITGGLGPTSDDFTREVINEWASTKLMWDEDSWQQIIERLTSRNYPVRDIQKQQCYFPEGATILKNTQGTANGFMLQAKGKTLFVLPGPPKEIEAIWETSIESWIQSQTQNLDRHITRSWDTIGYGESEVARHVIEALQGSDLEVGYRVHMPYVEVKLSYLKSQEKEALKWVQAVDEKISFMTALRDGEDAAQKFVSLLKPFCRIEVFDEVSGSYLLSRIEPHTRSLLHSHQIRFQNHGSPSESQDFKSETGLVFYTQFLEENRVKAGLIRGHQTRETVFESPVTSITMKERRKQYFTEMAFLFWSQQLQDL